MHTQNTYTQIDTQIYAYINTYKNTETQMNIFINTEHKYIEIHSYIH